MTLLQSTDRTILGASLASWMTAFAAAAIAVVAIYVLRRVLLGRLTALAERTQTGADDAVVALLRRSPLMLAVFAVSRVLAETVPLTGRVERLLVAAGTLALFAQIGLWVSAIIRFWAERVVSRREHVERGRAEGTVRALSFALRVLLWTVLLLVALDTFDIDVTALIAGLGIGGIAVALAVQNILGDVFAALAIVLDKPFAVGDTIQVDQFTGTVQHVGIKTTRLRGVDGEEIIFPNSNLLQSRIRNYRRMAERRVVLLIRVPHETPTEQLEAIAGVMRDVIQTEEQVRFDRAHLDRFDDVGIVFEGVYFVMTADFNVHMDIKQAISLRLLDRLRSEGIPLAYPTRRALKHDETTDEGADRPVGDGRTRVRSEA